MPALPDPPSKDEVPHRPGIGSRSLPGAIQQLVATGDIAPDAAGLAELAAELPTSWWMVSSESGQLDQRGWPMRHDVALACRACACLPELPAPARAELEVVRAWLAGKYPTEALATGRQASAAVHYGIQFAELGYPEEAMLSIFASIVPAGTEEDRRTFLATLRQPPASAPAWLAVECAYLAREGWLMYYVHRGLASPVAICAAQALRAAVRRGAAWPEVVGWARELV